MSSQPSRVRSCSPRSTHEPLSKVVSSSSVNNAEDDSDDGYATVRTRKKIKKKPAPRWVELDSEDSTDTNCNCYGVPRQDQMVLLKPKQQQEIERKKPKPKNPIWDAKTPSKEPSLNLHHTVVQSSSRDTNPFDTALPPSGTPRAQSSPKVSTALVPVRPGISQIQTRTQTSHPERHVHRGPCGQCVRMSGELPVVVRQVNNPNQGPAGIWLAPSERVRFPPGPHITYANFGCLAPKRTTNAQINRLAPIRPNRNYDTFLLNSDRAVDVEAQRNHVTAISSTRTRASTLTESKWFTRFTGFVKSRWHDALFALTLAGLIYFYTRDPAKTLIYANLGVISYNLILILLTGCVFATRFAVSRLRSSSTQYASIQSPSHHQPQISINH